MKHQPGGVRGTPSPPGLRAYACVRRLRIANTSPAPAATVTATAVPSAATGTSAPRTRVLGGQVGRARHEVGQDHVLGPLARVLAQRTPLLLLDEPTAAPDLEHQELVLRVCRERARAGDAVAVVLYDLTGELLVTPQRKL